MSHNHENNNINSLHYVPPHIHKKVWVTVPDYKKIDEIFEKKNNYKLDNSVVESRHCDIGDSYNYCDKDEFVCNEHSERKCSSYTYNNCDGCAEDCSECNKPFYSSISNLYKSDENTCDIIDMEDDETLFYNISVIDKIFKEYKIKDRVLINIFKRLNKSMRARNNLRIIENLQSFIVRLDVIDNNELYQEIMYEINIIKDTKKNEIIETIPTGI